MRTKATNQKRETFIKIFSSLSSRDDGQGKFFGCKKLLFDPLILQREIQEWIVDNPRIEILQMVQSQHMQEASDNRLPWITISLLYTR